MDIHIENGVKSADPSWESAMKIEVHEEDDAWIAKLVIPFESLGVNPDTMEKTWRANFYRTERYGDRRISQPGNRR